MSWRMLQEMKAVPNKDTRKVFELVIPFLEDWKENDPDSTVEWVVDVMNTNAFNTFLFVLHLQTKFYPTCIQ